MQRHPFDAVSAALGALAIALGALVASGTVGSFDTRGAWWLAGAAIVVGLAIIPWRTPLERLGQEDTVTTSEPDGRLG